MIIDLECKPKGVVTCEVRREGELISRTQGENALTPRLKSNLAMLLGDDRPNNAVQGSGALSAADSQVSYMQVIFPTVNNQGRYSTVGGRTNATYGRTTTPAVTAGTVATPTAELQAGHTDTYKLQYQQVFNDIVMSNAGYKLAFRLYGGVAVGTPGAETQVLSTCNADAGSGETLTSAQTRRYLQYELWGEKIDVAPAVQIVEGDSVTCTYEIYPAMVLTGAPAPHYSRPVVDELLCTALMTANTTNQRACRLQGCGITSDNTPDADADFTNFSGTAKPATNVGNTATFSNGDFNAAYTVDTTAQNYQNLGYTDTGGTPQAYAQGDVLVGSTSGVFRAGIAKSTNSLGAAPLGGYASVNTYAANTRLANAVAHVAGGLGYNAVNVNKRHHFQFRVKFA